jgi:hypothetical protein
VASTAATLGEGSVDAGAAEGALAGAAIGAAMLGAGTDAASAQASSNPGVVNLIRANSSDAAPPTP